MVLKLLSFKNAASAQSLLVVHGDRVTFHSDPTCMRPECKASDSLFVQNQREVAYMVAVEPERLVALQTPYGA